MLSPRRFLILVLLVVAANALLVFSVSGRTMQRRSHAIPVAALKTGDVVLRNGYGLMSAVFRKANTQEAEFSHAGIVLRKDAGVFVAHLQQEQAENALQLEPLEQFTDHSVCSKAAVCRFDLSEQQRKQLFLQVEEALKQQKTFDVSFDLADSKAMYCTEWIRHLLVATTGDSTYIPFSKSGDFRYIAPDNIYRNPHARILCSIHY
jgi:hypothetical protein